uniref:Ig-like domain-containing protein n=1 Tax=Cyprinodon variegatus TaxID=28743 RepID=A0A3Q2DLC1_CYPVA
MARALAAFILLISMTVVGTLKVPDNIPLTQAGLGKTVNLICNVSGQEEALFFWYKMSYGYMVQTVVSGSFVELKVQKSFPESRFKVKNEGDLHILTINNVSKEDEAIYLCQAGAYNLIIISGNSKKTSSYTVVQQSTASESSRPQESETLQCSVLSESENNSCSEDLSMFWFKAGSNRPYPNIIYTDTKRANNCEKSPNTRRKCTYNFPKNISSSDPGTYYCAVATCGEILLGNVIRKEGGNIPLALMSCHILVFLSLEVFHITSVCFVNARSFTVNCSCLFL